MRKRRTFLAAVVPPRLRLVAARFHIAPAAAVILADIQEEPAAIFGCAGSYPVQFVRGQQVCC